MKNISLICVFIFISTFFAFGQCPPTTCSSLGASEGTAFLYYINSDGSVGARVGALSTCPWTSASTDTEYWLIVNVPSNKCYAAVEIQYDVDNPLLFDVLNTTLQTSGSFQVYARDITSGVGAKFKIKTQGTLPACGYSIFIRPACSYTPTRKLGGWASRIIR